MHANKKPVNGQYVCLNMKLYKILHGGETQEVQFLSVLYRVL